MLFTRLHLPIPRVFQPRNKFESPHWPVQFSIFFCASRVGREKWLNHIWMLITKLPPEYCPRYLPLIGVSTPDLYFNEVTFECHYVSQCGEAFNGNVRKVERLHDSIDNEAIEQRRKRAARHIEEGRRGVFIRRVPEDLRSGSSARVMAPRDLSSPRWKTRLRGWTNDDDRFCRRSLLLLLIFPLMTVPLLPSSPSPRYPLLTGLPSRLPPVSCRQEYKSRAGRCSRNDCNVTASKRKTTSRDPRDKRGAGSPIRIGEPLPLPSASNFTADKIFLCLTALKSN